jgi:uncharacterized membrane protein YccC
MAIKKATSRIVLPLKRMAAALPHMASPYQRFRHAQGLHALRVALAMLTTILITSGFHMQHGDWASVSMLIVIGGIQHHGNIRKKASERALGTTVGATAGLALILLHAVVGSEALIYGLIALSSGICAYYAIGRAGYIALLTAITIVIVAGHGDNSIETGSWRALNVFIGIAVALIFSFALPLHATYSWRFSMALNLRRCARIIRHALSDNPPSSSELNTMFADVTRRSISLRTLLPSVAKEMNVPQSRLEEIQDQHRSMLSALEMLSSSCRHLVEPDSGPVLLSAFAAESQHMRSTLLGIAVGLRDESKMPLALMAEQTARRVRPRQPLQGIETELHGPYWLLQQLIDQVERLQHLLLTVRH